MQEYTGSDYVIALEDVYIQYGPRTILEAVNLNLRSGEMAYLIGRTGAGKSSLLKLLYADVKPQKGQVWVAGHAVHSIDQKQIPFLRRKLGIIFQDFQLLPDRSVADNLMFVLKATGWADSKEMKNRVADVLMQVGLSARANEMPHNLSGGEQQRTSIARALLNSPELILADEPTGNLDPEVADAIMQLLQRIHREGTAILMATHNHDIIARFPAPVHECRDGSLQTRR